MDKYNLALPSLSQYESEVRSIYDANEYIVELVSFTCQTYVHSTEIAHCSRADALFLTQ